MFNNHHAPSRANRKIICDVCGQQFRLHEVVQVTDKHNRHFGLIVCHRDLDPTNPHDIPYEHKERILTAPKLVRPLGPINSMANANDDRLPSAPRYGEARRGSLDNYIHLDWQGPLDTGSSGIIGYTVSIANPQLSTFTVLVSDTSSVNLSPAPYYVDTDTAVDSACEYKVAAINSFGTGPYSDIFLYPSTIYTIPASYEWLGVSQTGAALCTSDGDPLLFSPDI